jgi:hypothetical protein
MRRRDLGKFRLGDVLAHQGRGEVVEVTDHRGREVEVQLAAWRVSCTEAVTRASRNEDERAGWTDHLALVEVHHVFAFDHVERLGAIVMHVHGRP